MPFKQGDSNINRKGRPKGSGYSLKLREQVTSFCEDNLLYFLEEIKNMRNGHAKAQAFISLLNFALPKLTESNSYLDIESLSDEDLDRIFKKLISNENEEAI